MKRYLLSLFISLISCGHPVLHHIDPYFIPLLSRFKSDAAGNKISLGSISSVDFLEFSSLPITTLGICNYNLTTNLFSTEFYKSIYINYNIIINDTDMQYKVLLHELGHCVYHLAHNISDSDSIMYAQVKEPTSNFPEEIKQFFIDAEDNQLNWYSENSP